MVILYNFLPNLRSPESVGEIRKSVARFGECAGRLRFPADSGHHRWLAERGGGIALPRGPQRMVSGICGVLNLWEQSGRAAARTRRVR